MPKVSKLVYFEKKKKTLYIYFPRMTQRRRQNCFPWVDSFYYCKQYIKFAMRNRLSSKYWGEEKTIQFIVPCSESAGVRTYKNCCIEYDLYTYL
jgi:hypothetical protein